MDRKGRTSLASQGSTKWGQSSRPRGFCEGGEGIWEHCAAKGGRQAGRVVPLTCTGAAGVPSPSFKLLSASSPAPQPQPRPIPTEQGGNHIGLPSWLWCEAVVVTLSPSQLGKGLLESTLSSQEQGGKSPTPGAVRNHHKHPRSGPGRQQVCGQAAGMQAGTPVCAKAILRSGSPLPRHTRNSSRSPTSILSP